MAFNDFSPRLGLTYNVTGDGRTLARANYARYFGQVGNGGVATTINPVGSTTLRYPWIDANRNQVAEVGEITLERQSDLGEHELVSRESRPTRSRPTRSIPNLKNDTTDEFILGLDREVGRGFAVGANYIYRKYGNFQWNDREGITSADWVQTTFTPTGCPGDDGLRTEAAQLRADHVLLAGVPAADGRQLTNVPDYTRVFNGFELTGRKRLSNRWMMNTSFAYNATKVNFGSFPGGQPSSAAATIIRGPVESRVPRGLPVRLPDGGQRHRQHLRQLEVAVQGERSLRAAVHDQLSRRSTTRGRVTRRSLGPEPACSATLTTGCRGNGSGQIDVLLNPVGETRLPNFHNLDFHVERPIRSRPCAHSVAGHLQRRNGDTVQAIRSRQNAANANQIQAIVAPRVLRFGVRVNW